MAVWKGWRSKVAEDAVVARAVGLAFYSGDPETADRYLDKIFEIIALLEHNPEMGHACPKALGCRRFVIGTPAPGNPDTLVYCYESATEVLIGDGRIRVPATALSGLIL